MKKTKRIRRADRRKYHYIYETICLISHRFYIGMHSTDNLQDGYCGSGTYLWRSINKYGKDKHVTKILEFLPDRESLRNREKELINEELLGNQFCMNLALGGDGGHGSKFLTKEQIIKGGKRAREVRIKLEKENPELRKTREKNQSNALKKQYDSGKRQRGIFCDWTGKKHKESTKHKIGEANSAHQKGKGNSQYGTCWIYHLELKQNKKISKEKLNTYLSQGWVKGRKIPF